MEDLLFLSQRIPYPPNKGDKIRSFRLVERLSQEFLLHLGFFIDDPDDWRHVDALRPYCKSIKAVGLSPLKAKVRALPAFLTGRSLSEPYFYSADLATWVRETIEVEQPDNCMIFSSPMAQYLEDADYAAMRVAIDYVDVDSDKWRQYAEQKTGLSAWVYRREAEKLLSFEKKIGSQAPVLTFVSEAEADLFRHLAPELADRTSSVSNGVDTEFFSPDHNLPKPDEYTSSKGPVIAFTGRMDYWPNEDAAHWFAKEVFPAVRERYTDAVFAIVGAAPTEALLNIAKEQEGVCVTGRVDDIRSYIHHADLIVAPLRIARGIQNKVLEGMAMGKCVISSPEGYEGIIASPDRDFLLAREPESYLSQITFALEDDNATRIGQKARAHMVATYPWSVCMDRMVQLLGNVADDHRPQKVCNG